MGQESSLMRPILESLGVYDWAGSEEAIFDAGVAIEGAFECLGVISLLGVNQETDATLRKAHQGMIDCLKRTLSRDTAISDFRRFIASQLQAEQAAVIGEIFDLAVAQKPYSTPQSIREPQQQGAQQPQPSAAPHQQKPSHPQASAGDEIDQLLNGLVNNARPEKGGAVPRANSPSAPVLKAPSGSPQDPIDQLLRGAKTLPPSTRGPQVDDGSSEIDVLLRSLGD